VTDQDTSLASAQAKALIEVINARRDTDCETLRAEARREAARIVTAARKRARRKFHEAARRLRRDNARRIAEAEAERDTELRMRRQRARAALLKRSWPLLTDALTERWRDGAARARWIKAALGMAAARLGRSRWQIEYPAADSEDVRQALAEMSDELTDIECVMEGSEAIGAGLRITTGGAVIDATPEALIALHGRVEAALIAEIERLTGEDERADRPGAEAAHG